MSSYNAIAKKKGSKKFETVFMQDDYFGNHNYGVVFNDGSVLRPDEVDFAPDYFTCQTPADNIREIWDEMKEMGRVTTSDYREQELRDKYEKIETLFGHESTLCKAIIYYLDQKNV